MRETDSKAPRLGRIQRGGLILGLAGILLSVIGLFTSGPAQFFQAYLISYLFWLGIALGTLSILMLHYLVGGNWGFLLRQVLEAAAKTTWPAAVLFIPLLFGLRYLYPWVGAGEASPVVDQSIYLNIPFFIVRALIYFLAWSLLTRLLIRWAHTPAYTHDPLYRRRLQQASSVGLVIYGLTMTFASVDWIMSLQPAWVSTVFGMLMITAQALGGMAFGIALLPLVLSFQPLASLTSPTRIRDLGALLLTLVVFWAYIAFSQYLVIWSGNLPREVIWFLDRSAGGWTQVIALVIVVQFVLPFIVLLSLRAKRSVRVISGLSLAILFMRWLDTFWLIKPAFHPQGVTLHWLDATTLLGLGGLWAAAFVWFFQRTPPPVLPEEHLTGQVIEDEKVRASYGPD